MHIVENRATRGLDHDAVNRYKGEGYIFPMRAFSAAQAVRYVEEMAGFELRYQGGRAKQVLRQKPHIVLPWINEIMRTPAILDTVESIIGPNILVWMSSFFIKQPHDGTFVSWHQDGLFWGLEADDIVSAWIALTPSNIKSGCMQMIPRSHLSRAEHEFHKEKDNLLLQGQTISVPANEDQAVNLELAAGEYSFHHQQCVHGSKTNSSDLPRIGLAIRYLKPDAKQKVDEKDSATLVRGVDPFGNFMREPVPQAEMETGCVNFLEDLLKTKYGGRYRATEVY